MNLRNQISLQFSAILIAICLISCDKNDDLIHRPKPEVSLFGERLFADSIYLDTDTVYLLNGDISRNAGQLLFVEPGTLVKVANGRGVTINQGATFIANGTSDAPIVFTSDALKGTGGFGGNFWSGIAINGSTGSSSGSLGFLRVEYSQGLSFIEVDRSTVINNIQVSYAINANAFVFSGGDAEAHNLVSYAAGGTDFLINAGYTGKLQNILAYRNPFYPVSSYFPTTLAGIHITGAGTSPAISNLSVLGPDAAGSPGAQYSGTKATAMLVSDNAKINIRNSVLAGFPNGGLYVESREAALTLQSGASSFMHTVVQCADTARSFYLPAGLVSIPGAPPVTPEVFRQFMLSSFQNSVVALPENLQLTDPFNYEGDINPVPLGGSPLLSGTDFNSTIFSDPFFRVVSFRGAVGTENWMNGWSNFIPSRTAYNR